MCDRLDRIDESLATLIDQVARFTEGLTKLENLISDGFGSLDKRLDHLTRTTEQQARTIDRQIEHQEAQAARHERQIERYERMLDRLMPVIGGQS